MEFLIWKERGKREGGREKKRERERERGIQAGRFNVRLEETDRDTER
jgi:hypothetical protein